LREGLETKTTTDGDDRKKRASTSDWDSTYNSNYNLVQSRSGRRRDVSKYPLHRGYLWATEIGYPAIHADIAAGGFGGVGFPGIKLYARARFDLVVWKKTYTALDIMFSYVRDFPDRNSVSTLTYKRYIKIVGFTLLNKMSTTTRTYKFTHSWQRTVPLFRVNYNFFILVGYLKISLTSQISGQMNFNAYIAPLNINGVNMKASAMLETGPTLTVKGEATTTPWPGLFRLGMKVSASITYLINPKASTSLCGSSSQDADTCFENESEICSYEYHAGVELAKGEKVSVSAKVDISCESVGVFNSELSARFCMKVRNSVVKKTSEDNN
uniref:Uncharacterized protein n=1 Tax=Amphimedon queenslandica TaxID=400682 RepID=A0A1X7USU5_AMPQE